MGLKITGNQIIPSGSSTEILIDNAVFSGSVPIFATLSTQPSPGDYIVADTNGVLYRRSKPPGLPGDIGFQGPQGVTGFTGSMGSQGSQGSGGGNGDPGAYGPQGAPGISAPSGSQGYTGRTGTQGPQASPSAPGPQGDPGVQFANFSGISAISGFTDNATFGIATGVYINNWGQHFSSSNTSYIDIGQNTDDAFTIVTSGNYYIQWAFSCEQPGSNDICYLGYDFVSGSVPVWNTGGKVYGNTSYHKNTWVMGWAGYIDTNNYDSRVMFYDISGTGGQTVDYGVVYIIYLG
jgi:hypothetical protein